VAEAQDVAVSGLRRPHGLAFHDGWLYVANTNGVVRVRLGSDGKAQGTPEKVNEYSEGGGHWTRSILFGADGGMYVSIGSTCNICEEQSPDRAAVMRYDADGKNGRLYSSGLRNAVGMAINPSTRQIWVTQNERDDIKPDHQDLPPEEINILRDGANFGWPYCHSNRVPNPEFNDAGKCASTEPPALAMQAHSAPLGITFLDRATKLPAEYRGDALVAFHGSWNRTEPTGVKLVRSQGARRPSGGVRGLHRWLAGRRREALGTAGGRRRSARWRRARVRRYVRDDLPCRRALTRARRQTADFRLQGSKKTSGLRAPFRLESCDCPEVLKSEV
jgi:glucose/arabinose dehydrogenase